MDNNRYTLSISQQWDIIIILVVYSIALAIGTVTHTIDALLYGWPYPSDYVPKWVSIYWSSLLIFDPLAIFLLWKKRRIGLFVLLVIMMTDVAINSYAFYVLKLTVFNIFLQLQTLFLGFVIGTVYYVWPERKLNGKI